MQILEHRMFIGVQCYNYLAMATLSVDAGNLLWAFWDVALLFVHVSNHDFDDIMYINERKMYISEMLVCVCISEIHRLTSVKVYNGWQSILCGRWAIVWQREELLRVNTPSDGVTVLVTNLHTGDAKNKKELNIKTCILVLSCPI